MRKVKALFLGLLSLLVGCASVFETGSTLADFQDDKFKDYLEGGAATKEEMRRLERNLWVRTADKLAPGNLVVRHYCLIDLLSGKPRHERRIFDQYHSEL